MAFFFFAWQEAFTKAAGKKSKTSVELDLGDMLAALEKQQQAMRARQLTNTKPLSLTGIYKQDNAFTQLFKIKNTQTILHVSSFEFSDYFTHTVCFHAVFYV